MPKQKSKLPKRPSRASTRADTSGLTLGNEMSAAASGVLARSLARAVDKAAVLESIGHQAFSTVGELSRSASPDELLRSSHTLRALVLHGLDALSELQTAVGCLAALAAVREAELSSQPDDSNAAAALAAEVHR